MKKMKKYTKKKKFDNADSNFRIGEKGGGSNGEN